MKEAILRNTHYALWTDYSKHPYLSKDFLKDGQAAQQWVDSNAPLFSYFWQNNFNSGRLGSRSLFTHAGYALINKEAVNVGQKCTKASEKIPLCKLGGLWHGRAINQNKSEIGGIHRDLKDTNGD